MDITSSYALIKLQERTDFMSMPRDLLLVRHGHSEANEIQAKRKQDPTAETPEGFHDRHDSFMRLSVLGVNQAVQTGDWLREEFPEGFDAYYSSPHTRTIETAGRMALKGEWNLDDRLRERDWGEFGLLNDEQRQTQYAISLRLMGQNKWYWCPAGGESLATGVRLRYRDILDTWHREQAGKKLLAIVHGEVIDVAMFEHERLIPSDWLQRDKDPNYKVSNCQILHYSRTNPKTGELTEKLQWRRAICAWDESRSWNEGQWVKLERKRYEDTELLNMAANHPPLLRDEDSVK